MSPSLLDSTETVFVVLSNCPSDQSVMSERKKALVVDVDKYKLSYWMMTGIFVEGMCMYRYLVPLHYACTKQKNTYEQVCIRMYMSD